MRLLKEGLGILGGWGSPEVPSTVLSAEGQQALFLLPSRPHLGVFGTILTLCLSGPWPRIKWGSAACKASMLSQSPVLL